MFGRIDRMFPGDMPDFDRTLVMAEAALRTAKASVKHIIIISDGDPTPPSAAVMANLVKGRVSVSTVFISSHGGPGNPVYQQGFRLMQSVASQTGGRFWPLRLSQIGQLPQIFIREATEVRRASIVEETFVPAVAGPSPILRGIGTDRIPPLRGYVATTPKELSDLILISHQEDPVLVTWRYMLGKVAAFTSDATARWAQDWLPWSDYKKFWAQTVRWASRSSDRRGFRVGRLQEGERTRLVIDALDSEGRFRNYLRIRGRSLDPSRRGESIPFQQIGPGRYAADLRVALPGTYLVHVEWASPYGERGNFVTGLSMAYSPEFRNLRTQDVLLEELARIGGGRFAEPDELVSGETNPFRRDLPPTVMSREIFSTLIVLAVWLLLADVFVRRVAIDWAKVWASARARAAVLLGRVRPARVPDARLEALLETKARVRDRAQRRAYTPEAAAGDAPPEDLEAPETAAPAGAGPAKPSPEGEATREEKPEDAGYTRRLLDAKRRAIRRGRES
jgi:hypothetical protein